jgi:hypothetical protein
MKAREAVIEHKEGEWKKELESVKEIFRQKTEVETVATLLRQEVLELRAQVSSVGGSKDILESAHRANQAESSELSKLNERMSQQLNQLTNDLNREKDNNTKLISNFLRTAMPAVANLRNSCGLGPVRFGGEHADKLEMVADSLSEIQLEFANKIRLNRGTIDELASARGPRNSLQSMSTTSGEGGSLGGSIREGSFGGRDRGDFLSKTMGNGSHMPPRQTTARDQYYLRALAAGQMSSRSSRGEPPARVCASAFACAPSNNSSVGGFDINSLDYDDFRSSTDDFRDNTFTESRRVTSNKITFNRSMGNFTERAQQASRRTSDQAELRSRPLFTQSTEDQSLFYARRMYDDRPVWERTWHGVPSANATPRH